jgi:propanol-preferring alcohol dehydrogenase
MLHLCCVPGRRPGLRNTPAKSGDLVAVLGIGGLGHLALQYARHMGFEVIAIARGDDKAELAKKLGAHHYINSEMGSIAQALQSLGGAAVVASTASSGRALAEAVQGLAPGGVLLTLGATSEPLSSTPNDLIFSGRSITGALTGYPRTGGKTLKFSVLTGVAAMVETMPLELAAEAYAKMMSGRARFRIVLTMKSLPNAGYRCSEHTGVLPANGCGVSRYKGMAIAAIEALEGRYSIG